MPPSPAGASAALTAPVVVAADRPLLTYCDDATGERAELTAVDLGGWASRTAAMLRAGYGVGAGDRVAVMLPPHWQTAAVLLGAWSLGASVEFRPWATAGLDDPDPLAVPFDALFVSRRRLDSWLETVPEAWHRFVLGLTAGVDTPAEPPDGYRDYLAEVARYPDAPPAYQEVPPAAPASPDGTSQQQWAEVAHAIAGSLGLRPGDRVLVEVGAHEQPVAWLLAPLLAGASIVLVANLDPDSVRERMATEGATHVL